MFLYKMNLPELMEITIKIAVIVLAITTMALAPSISFSQPTKAATDTHWCANQGKSSEWVNGCKQGWSDHDHCFKYEPTKGETTAFVDGYKVGWPKGSCKK